VTHRYCLYNWVFFCCFF